MNVVGCSLRPIEHLSSASAASSVVGSSSSFCFAGTLSNVTSAWCVPHFTAVSHIRNAIQTATPIHSSRQTDLYNSINISQSTHGSITMAEYQFKVDMPCEGCSNAIRRALNKNFGEELAAVDTDLSTQLVKVSLKNSAISYEQVKEVLTKTGKTVTEIPQ